mmetsp:Transcript_128400/g.221821  ORF Transcript_128400/g.221821 Transcript_128400/m.221821 type:complete len:81 (-) Transcript_128400:619-861(-)
MQNFSSANLSSSEARLTKLGLYQPVWLQPIFGVALGNYPFFAFFPSPWLEQPGRGMPEWPSHSWCWALLDTFFSWMHHQF